METTLQGAALRERARLVLAVPLARALDIGLLDDDDPAAGAALTVGDLAGNGIGGTHAAALAAGLELAAYLALAPHLGVDEHAVTHMSTLTLLAPAAVGSRVELRGNLDRRTRRLAFAGALAVCDGVLVARAAVTKSVVPFGPRVTR